MPCNIGTLRTDHVACSNVSMSGSNVAETISVVGSMSSGQQISPVLGKDPSSCDVSSAVEGSERLNSGIVKSSRSYEYISTPPRVPRSGPFGSSKSEKSFGIKGEKNQPEVCVEMWFLKDKNVSGMQQGVSEGRKVYSGCLASSEGVCGYAVSELKKEFKGKSYSSSQGIPSYLMATASSVSKQVPSPVKGIDCESCGKRIDTECQYLSRSFPCSPSRSTASFLSSRDSGSPKYRKCTACDAFNATQDSIKSPPRMNRKGSGSTLPIM